MTVLRPGVRALRLPIPGIQSSSAGMECRVVTDPHEGLVRFLERTFCCLKCRVADMDGNTVSPAGNPLAWPAAYLLPLWDDDEDVKEEKNQEIEA